MLLSRWGGQRFRAAAQNDDGMALAAVMGLMAVLFVISAFVVSSALTATAFTTSTRAEVQSRAAAEAGIDAARVALAAGSCTATGPVTSIPTGTYQVSVFVPSGSNWTSGCPSTGSSQVRLVATGTALANGSRGATGGDTTTMAAVLSLGATTGVAGPAVYSSTANSLSAGASILPYNGSSPDVMIKSGDVTCSGGALNAVSNLVVDNGGLTLSGSCAIAGNAFSSGALNLSGTASVGGTARASSIAFTSGGSIGGSIWAPGALTFSGSGAVGGNASAGSLAFSRGGTISGNAWVAGGTAADYGASIRGDLTTATVSGNNSTAFVSGTIRRVPAGPGPSPYVAPPIPPVPSWIDYRYDPASWPGYTIVTLSGGTCGNAELSAALASIGGNKGVIDARGCTGGVDPGTFQPLTLRNNLAIFANSFNLAGSASFTSSSPVSLWLVTPDNTPDNAPTCTSGSSFALGGGFAFAPSVSTMIYTPCTMNLSSGNTLYGQIWAGQVSTSGSGKVYFVPVGLPGYDLGVGAVIPSTATRTVVSMNTVN